MGFPSALGMASLENDQDLLDDSSCQEILPNTIGCTPKSLLVSSPSTSCHDTGRHCCDMARTLFRRHECTGNGAVLIEAIRLGRLSVATCATEHPYRAVCCSDLAKSLWTHYQSNGDEQLLTEAINLQRESLTLLPSGHPDCAEACGGLAVLLRTQYQASGDVLLLNEAIDLLRQSLSLYLPGHPERARTCGELAVSLRTLYDFSGDSQLLTEAINLDRESLSLRPLRHVDRAASCINLALSLWTRHNSTGDIQLLMEAIDLQRESLALRPPGDPGRARSCGHLSMSLLTCYNCTGDDQLLTEAIDLQQESLILRPPGHPDRSFSFESLAFSLRTRYSCTNENRLLYEAIAYQRESLALRPLRHPDRARSCENLSVSLRMLVESTSDKAFLHEIFTICTEGLSLAYPSEKWRHASVLVWLHLQPDSRFYDLSLAIKMLYISLENYPDSASQAIAASISCLDMFWGAGSALQLEHRVDVADIYRRLIRLLPLLNNPVLEAKSQLQALRLCNQLGPDTFVNAVFAGDWQSGIEELEVVQGLYWTQHVHYRDPQLDHLPPKLAATLNPLLKVIVGSPGETAHAPLRSRDLQHNSMTHVYSLLREIRALPGLDRFMLGESFEGLRSVASSHPVVVLVGVRDHYYALLLTTKSPCRLMTLALKTQDLTTMLSMQHGTRHHRGMTSISMGALEADGHRGMKMKNCNKSSSLTHLMRYVWMTIVKPVLDELGLGAPVKAPNRPRLHWYPTGDFTLLPLHAAGIYDGPENQHTCCADYVVSSYTPTLTTLLRAQKATTPLQKADSQLALVAEKRALETHLQILYEVDAEVDSIAQVARLNSIEVVHRLRGPITISNTCAAMQAANVVHLACHGIQDSRNALDSGFCLGDGRLTISQLMKLKLQNPFLAFLSACETAKGDRSQPDQVMHLASAMMFIGYKTVVATMWAISDIDGPKVARWFYEELFKRDVMDGDSVAYALDKAVRNLCNCGVSLDRWAPFIQIGL